MTDFHFTSAADGATLHGCVMAAPNSPKAVLSLVHGYGEHCARYQGMADDFAAHGIAVVACDLRGHGRSAGKRGSVKAYADLHGDLDALLEQSRARYAGVPHVLYGHSMGGGLVLNHLLADPSAGHDLYGVIATAPLLRLASPPPKPAELFVRLLRRIAPGLVIKNPIDGTKISTLLDEQAAYMNDPLNHGSMNAPLAAGMVEAGEEALAAAQKWTVPILLMHSTGDRLTDYQASLDFAAHAQNCQFHSFDNVEHEIHNDKTRDAVYRLMRDFILTQTQRASA